MAKRVLVGVIAAVVLVALIWLHRPAILFASVIVALIVQYEIIKTIKSSGVQPMEILLYAFSILLLPACYYGGITWAFTLQMGTVAMIFIAAIIFPVYNYESVFSSIFMVYYPQLFFVFLYLIVTEESVTLSRMILMVSFAASVMTDSCAYFVGKFLGKTPLCPRISPNKTVEGAIGGLVGGMLGVIIIALIFDQSWLNVLQYVILALILSALAQFGDLAASLIKRRYGVKDFGSIIPSHGGMLDRVDSALFTMPFAYIYFAVLAGLL